MDSSSEDWRTLTYFGCGQSLLEIMGATGVGFMLSKDVWHVIDG
jgi:hypothetical protein